MHRPQLTRVLLGIERRHVDTTLHVTGDQLRSLINRLVEAPQKLAFKP